jgi:glycine dehydrogenase subunit 1
MPFLPTSGHDLKEILDCIGIDDVEQLFTDIPSEARCKAPLKVEGPLDELALRRRFQVPAQGAVFLGGGIYRHFIPAVVDAMASRQEFLTAYTPYQPEISQGTLQATFEFQSMMASLTGMDASNASMYDGATALAEAAIMATRAKGVNRVVISRATNPAYRGVVQTYFKNNPAVTLVEAPFDPVTGKMSIKALEDLLDGNTAFFIQQPNYFGIIEDMEIVSSIASRAGFWGIVVGEALSLGGLKPPGSFGCDVVVGEAQSLGNPANAGGPLLGFFCTKKEHIRRIPGRIIGLTKDLSGKRAFCLTLSTREQHIRREKATSNICTNEGLCTLRAAVYLSALGPKGLRDVAMQCAAGARTLIAALKEKGISPLFASGVFNEFVVRMDKGTRKKLEDNGIAYGIPLESHYSEIEDGVLMTMTEMNTDEDIRCLTHLL